MSMEDLERQLRAALAPKAPHPAFVKTVEERFHPPLVSVASSRRPFRERFLFAAGSVLVGFLALLTLARLFYYLSGYSRKNA